jgi:hypothetical protein
MHNKACQICLELYNEKKKVSSIKLNWNKEVKRTECVCLSCDVFLCSQHFGTFHTLLVKQKIFIVRKFQTHAQKAERKEKTIE